jgi:hypothetical protein
MAGCWPRLETLLLTAVFPNEILCSFSRLMVIDEILDRRSTAATLWLALAAAGVYLFIYEPGRSGFFPVCPFRALLHGHLAAAFMLNPLMVLLLPCLLYALVSHTHAMLVGRPLKKNILPAKYIYALFGTVLFFWIFRNTPFYPFPS